MCIISLFLLNNSNSYEHMLKIIFIFVRYVGNLIYKIQNITKLKTTDKVPRPQQSRKICNPPLMKGYKPFGIPRSSLLSVALLFDEYETIRLLDYEGLNQEQAAERMNVSRPTLTRIYEKARKNIAKAFVEGKMILIEGGNVQFDKEWFRCVRCHKLIEGEENHTPCNGCKNFGADELKLINRI